MSARRDALPASAVVPALRVFGLSVADTDEFTEQLRSEVAAFQEMIGAPTTGTVTEHVRDRLYDRPELAPEQEDAAVFALQHALNERGWRLRLNGVMDLDTVNALNEFQGRAAVTRSGVVDEETWAALGIAP